MFRLRLGLVIVGVLVLLGSWSVGDDKDIPIKARGFLPANWKKLGLSPDQVQSVYKVQGSYKAKIDELAGKIAALRKEEKAELEKILTPAQKERLKEIAIGETTTPKDQPSIKDKVPEKDKAPEKDKVPAKDKS